jgi:hypothetical protein
MTTAVFPKSIVPWTDRVDEVNVIWANDPNTLAAEVIAIEKTAGAMPQVEKAPYAGNPVTYSTMDARISDVLAGNQMPYASISSTSFYSHNTDRWGGGRRGHLNTYNKLYDPFGFYNGSDFTVPATGLYLVFGQQNWEWHDSGYCFHHCYVDGNWACGHRWDWDFGSSGPSYYDPDRPLTTAFSALLPIAAGKRVQSVSENGTSRSPYYISSSYLRIYCLRKLPQSALG